MGDNNQGELGLGNVNNYSSPVLIGSFPNYKAFLGGDFGAIIKSDGTLWAWGNNGGGVLGQGDVINRSSPTQIGSDTDWEILPLQQRNAVHVIKSDGTLWAWGDNAYGKLGLGDQADRSSPVQVGSGTNWKATAGGYASHTIFSKG
jgi:alpha-tubulin suppressor-like RCC1 family protein